MLALGGICDRGICELLTVQEVVPVSAEDVGTGDKRLEAWADDFSRRIQAEEQEEDDVAVLLTMLD